MSLGARILVVDDEPAILRTIRANLNRRGFDVDTATSGSEALNRYDQRRPDVILLDLGLPDVDGTEIIQAVRRRSATPIIVLSARGAERDKVEALELGADDFLTKPFGVEELLARIRVALRHVARPGSGADSVFRSGDLEVDVERRKVVRDGQLIHLTPTEYDLLKALIAADGRIVTDRSLIQQVWGTGYGADAHYLHVYVARLRKKLERGHEQRRLIVNEPGVGYRLVTDG